MSERTLKMLVGALAIAVGLLLVGRLFSGGSGSIAATGAVSDFFDRIDRSSVEVLQVEQTGQSISLERAGASWTVNGFPADSGSITRLLDVMDELEVGDLVASNPANHERMGVTDESGRRVTFTVAGTERTILVGEAGRRFGTSYVRLPDEDDVYLLDGDLRGQIARDLDGWRNRTMLAVDTTTIARIEVDRDDGSYVLAKGDSTWAFAAGGAVAPTAINGILAELNRLVASGFLAEGDSIGALGLASTTRAYSAGDELLAEITIGEGDGDRWARTNSDEYLYRVSSFRAGRIAPSREDAEPDS